MIVDCHTHIWESPEQLGPNGGEYLRRRGGKANVTATPDAHLAAADCVDKSLVLGFISRFVGAEVPNSSIAEFAGKHPDKIIGIAGIDPLADDALALLDQVGDNPVWRGVTLSPAAQDFHPAHSRVMQVYEYCAAKGLVVVVDQGPHFWRQGKLEYARPYLFDEVLRNVPNLHIVLSHLGFPWVDEALAMLGKHPNVYADLAGLIRRPWHTYNAVVKAHQFGVDDKLLFGSDYPFFTASEAVESFYRLNEIAHGSRMPAVPRETLRGIVERDALAALGIERPGDRKPDDRVVSHDEDD